jgi:hypothetical protein
MKSFAVAEAQKAYEVFCCFVGGNPQTQWDKIVHEMPNKGPCVCSWPSLMDCIELHKLTIFPVGAAEKQRY